MVKKDIFALVFLGLLNIFGFLLFFLVSKHDQIPVYVETQLLSRAIHPAKPGAKTRWAIIANGIRAEHVFHVVTGLFVRVGGPCLYVT